MKFSITLVDGNTLEELKEAIKVGFTEADRIYWEELITWLKEDLLGHDPSDDLPNFLDVVE